MNRLAAHRERDFASLFQVCPCTLVVSGEECLVHLATQRCSLVRIHAETKNCIFSQHRCGNHRAVQIHYRCDRNTLFLSTKLPYGLVGAHDEENIVSVDHSDHCRQPTALVMVMVCSCKFHFDPNQCSLN